MNYRHIDKNLQFGILPVLTLIWYWAFSPDAPYPVAEIQ